MTTLVSAKRLCIAAASGSAALLMAAFIFQSLGYAPCAMCIWQRYPHAVAIGAGALVFVGIPLTLAAIIGALSAASTSAIGVYHTGVERDWWEGPTSCSGSGIDMSDMSAADLLPGGSSGPTNLVMCDEVAWQFLTLSMASWNAIWSGVVAVVWLLAVFISWRSRENYAAEPGR